MGREKKLPPVEHPNVFMAVPLAKNGGLHCETARFCAILNQHPDVTWGFVNTLSAECSRNTLLEHHFRKDPCWTHVVFIDSDIVPPDDAIKKLLQLDADVAVGLCPIFVDNSLCWNVSKEEVDRTWIRMEDELPSEPFKVYSAGFGLVMVRREVLVDMGYPWFKTEYQELYKNGGKSIATGEDVYFIEKALGLGYDVVADPSLTCGHYNQVELCRMWNAIKSQVDSKNE